MTTDEIVKRLRALAVTIDEDVPILAAADRLEALESENKRLREALEFYATASGYDVDIDCGDRARAASREET
jgi:hypothetical protein